jgi:hypothetical protein
VAEQEWFTPVQHQVDRVDPLLRTVLCDTRRSLPGDRDADHFRLGTPALVLVLENVTVITFKIASAVYLEDELPDGNRHGLRITFSISALN